MKAKNSNVNHNFKGKKGNKMEFYLSKVKVKREYVL